MKDNYKPAYVYEVFRLDCEGNHPRSEIFVVAATKNSACTLADRIRGKGLYRKAERIGPIEEYWEMANTINIGRKAERRLQKIQDRKIR